MWDTAQNNYCWVSGYRVFVADYLRESHCLGGTIFAFLILTGQLKLKQLWKQPCLRTANRKSPNFIMAAAAVNCSNKLSLFFTSVLRQAVVTLCMLQHTYRPGTAVLLWRLVGGSGWSSYCGYQLALTELVRSHVYIALAEGCGQILSDSPLQCHMTRVGIIADKNLSIF